MRISNLTVQNFRNYSDLNLSPDEHLNIFLGRNAQGKTSLLEAVYILATARSWKASKDAELIRWGSDYARLTGKVIRDQQNDLEIEVILNKNGKKEIGLNTIRQTKLAEMIGQVNVVLIEPHNEEIVRGEPSRRRKFLNLEISQIQPQYCHLLMNYRRVLEQRNRFLKDLCRRKSADSVLDVLDDQLTVHGAELVKRRLAFLDKISSFSTSIHSRITDGSEELVIEYSSSLDLNSTDLAQAFRDRLAQVKEEEIRRGMTLAGPQRDDLIFKLNGIDARIYGSQGQQRTIALSLYLALYEVMEESAGESPIVLLDDVMTDLDEMRREHIFEMTSGRCQTLLTAASRRAFDPQMLSSARVFQVVDGQVIQE
jgi:DNA replication and repair protein RecF